MNADGRCRSCKEPIRWVITHATGKRMPLDPTPVPDGNVWVIEWRGSTPVVGVGLSGDDVPGSVPFRYVSHFVTCPDGESWRKNREIRAVDSD